jgi:ADP-heptose:LPS heptosyltransferase
VYYRIVKWLIKPRPEWSGNVSGCTFPFTSPYQMQMHICDAHAKQLEIAGISPTPLPSLEWLKESIKGIELPKKFFLMVPGCSASQAHKRWPAEYFATIAQRLVKEHKIIPVLIGTKEEEKELDSIKRACPKAINLMGETTLWQIPSLARMAVGALGHDTGPMHMITISDCPSTFLFSYSSIPARCGPKKSHSLVLKTDHLKDISVETVYKNLQFRNNPHNNSKA